MERKGCAVAILIMTLAMTPRGAVHAERLRGPGGTVREVPDESVRWALQDGWQKIPTVRMRDRAGLLHEVDEDLVAAALAQGWWRLTPSELSQPREMPPPPSRGGDGAASNTPVGPDGPELWELRIIVMVAVVLALLMLQPWRHGIFGKLAVAVAIGTAVAAASANLRVGLFVGMVASAIAGMTTFYERAARERRGR